LWDAADQRVMRCFMIPRATVLIATVTCVADERDFVLRATRGDAYGGILENRYIAANASTLRFECRITVHDDSSWSYDEDSVVQLARMGGQELHHTDRNTLRRAD
jgi:hypothetical protein